MPAHVDRDEELDHALDGAELIPCVQRDEAGFHVLDIGKAGGEAHVFDHMEAAAEAGPASGNGWTVVDGDPGFAVLDGGWVAIGDSSGNIPGFDEG